ncbi:putative ATP-dependent RNA helicase DDX49 [Histomonas meleagridis]|uniref:putative ATP-dependent RNA helicase DDX49 n=1 Tax=Histomonas meleagridis TaxID=135588 RepID=UPI003559FDCA|nr:putative ATP-dependent RNA helicase DDX49 [Histomonas meleagridis]KAH0803679.1 putative ATP-dependent RNA helicase DDX49 [Histomonas meleagridis]
MTNSFSSLKLPDFILRTCKQIGLTNPTPVQLATIPQILAGRNVVAISPTGSGKTAAFALPIISELSKDPYGIYCLILSPTRELAEQISDQFDLFGNGMKIDVAQILGGLSYNQQASIIERNPHILVATPGRLLQHLRSTTRVTFDNLRFLVLDEVDRLFSEGFWKDVEDIVKYLPEVRQTLLYSATFNEKIPISNILSKPPNVIKSTNFQPDEHQNLSDDGNTYFWKATIDQAPRIQHMITNVPGHLREIYLIILLEEIMKNNEYSQVLVFTNHCETTNVVTLILRRFKFKTAMLHSQMEQDDRFAAIRDFKSGSQRILVATDVAARGLDIPYVDEVIHFNPPPSATIYVHRAGRTGRAGRSGRSILFVNGNKDAKIVEEIQKEIGHELEVLKINEKEIVSKMNDVLNAKRDAKVLMYDNNFGEREKRLRQIDEAKSELGIVDK